MSFGPSGLGVTNYLGVNSPTPPNIITAIRAPDSNDYNNFNVGDLWLNISSLKQVPSIPPTAQDVYMLVSKAAQVATWVNFQGGNTSVTTLTGNTGGPVGVDNNDNINIVGDGTTITITGNPGTHTLTASTIGTGVLSALHPDTGGDVSPIAGIINIHNTDTNVITSNGGTNNLDINLATNLNITNNITAGGQIISNLPGGNNFVASGSGAMLLENDSNTDSGPGIGFAKTRAFGPTLLNDSLGSITFAGYTGVVGVDGAFIESIAQGNFSGVSAPGDLEFYTTAVASTTAVQRMVIGPSGNITINTPDSGASIISVNIYNFAVGGTNRAVLVDNVGNVGTAASSIRFKENIVDMKNFSDKLMNLCPKIFNFKNDENKTIQFGLIAEEVAQIMPELLSYDDNEQPYTVRYHDLPILLLNELQKLNKRVKLLEQKLLDV